jgi:glycine betaine/choline ABC-type transport system substrate-binding protein
MKSKSIITIVVIILSLSVIVSGCTSKSAVEKKVVVASKPFTESYILAEIISGLIEQNTDIIVERKMGIGGGTSNIQPAMVAGEIDIYPEYSGTGWLFVLKKQAISDNTEMMAGLKSEYSKLYGIKWLDPYGFNDTFALAVKRSFAEEKGLKTYSDLAKISKTLKFAAEYDFYEREDGYPGLVNTYGFAFKETKDVDIGLKYEAIATDQVDVINVFSTDALLLTNDLNVLADDKNFFPPYFAATLIREETLAKYPELEGVLNSLVGTINNDEMIAMNSAVDNDKKDPKVVAEEFLKSKGLI